MKKQIFRYLISEFNGVWIKGSYYFLNELSGTYNDIFAYMKNMVFKLETEDIRAHEIPISDEDLRGIGLIAGVFSPYISAESNAGSLVFTKSHIVDGVEYSERGLMNRNTESFSFFRTTPAVYADDITTLANHTQQASMVPDGSPILGYIADGTTVLDANGNIILSAILASPPVGVAYYPYYGEKYLFLSEFFLKEAYLDSATFKLLFESMQRIRYNGASITELAFLTETITEGYVSNISFTYSLNRVYLHYHLNEEAEVEARIKKLYIWKMILATKYKQVSIVEELV